MPALANHKLIGSKITLEEARIRAFSLIYIRHKIRQLISSSKQYPMTDEQKDSVLAYLQEYLHCIEASAYVLNKQIKEL